MKKETLEEAAERFLKDGARKFKTAKQVLIGFAKWQSERMYSEEEVLEIVQTFNDVCERPNKPHQIKNWFEQFKKK
jgi:hypothetical protein